MYYPMSNSAHAIHLKANHIKSLGIPKPHQILLGSIISTYKANFSSIHNRKGGCRQFSLSCLPPLDPSVSVHLNRSTNRKSNITTTTTNRKIQQKNYFEARLVMKVSVLLPP